MRRALLALLAGAILIPAAGAAAAQHRTATFPMASGFEDRLTIVSGAMEIEASEVSKSAGFFRTTAVVVDGLDKACWQPTLLLPLTCVAGPLSLEVPAGASFGFNPGAAYPVDLAADHALVTFVDLSTTDGFEERLRVGPSAISSLVSGVVTIGPVPPAPSGSPHGFSLLEQGERLELRDSTGLLIHRFGYNDPPLLVEGSPSFTPGFGAKVVVLPFEAGASASFRLASEAAAAEGLERKSIDLLDEILANVRIIGPDAKTVPFAILDRAGAFLSEIFNGAFIRTRLADDPEGFGDVAFAKFTDLSISDGRGKSLDFDGSYTLVVGDLGPSFNDSQVSQESQPLRWWVGLFLLLAILVVGIWLWRRDGPVQKAEPGPQTWVARIATSVGVVVAFLVWDWQLNEILGSSLLTTDGSGVGLGVLVLVELASLALAGLLIGIPVYLAVRYGLALAKQPRYVSLATTAGVFFTVAFGILLLPALVSFILGLAA